MFKLQTTKKFEKSVSKLPANIKKKLPAALRQLAADPTHNSLQSKENYIASQMHKEKVYESRIDGKYRLLWVYREGQIILLLLAGDHKIVEGKK